MTCAAARRPRKPDQPIQPRQRPDAASLRRHGANQCTVVRALIRAGSVRNRPQKTPGYLTRMRQRDDPRSPLPTIVLATRDRRQRLLATLARLDELVERPRVIVVDHASTDGTASAIRERFSDVTVIASHGDIGSASRTLGVEAADTPLVAFSDDDSWWAPGALRRAADMFETYPRLGLIAARILVEPGGRLDPTCAAMRDSPLDSDMPLPGPPVLGFLACGAVARRSAVLACGGFHARYGFGGEEHLLAVDMASAGWGLAYADDVVAHHEPEPGPRNWQGAHELRNQLWSTWLRRPLTRAARRTIALTLDGSGHGVPALTAAMRGLPWVLRERRVIPEDVERGLRLLEATSSD
jgi:N-acetylglucosaminyl-diphospho-decaprenol L-rhamnosyltransferase